MRKINLNVDALKKSSKVSFLLGMFIGDGCLTNTKNGDGNAIYPIRFYNTSIHLINLFLVMFYECFNVVGKIRVRKRLNKQDLFEFELYSVKLFTIFTNDLEIPSGKKAKSAIIPSYIKFGSSSQKIAFLHGLFLTDGGFSKDRIMFHCASKQLIEDIEFILLDMGISCRKDSFIQKGKYYSYQLTLNKGESFKFLCHSRITWYCADHCSSVERERKP